ncbi:DUF1707 domain-containing protein [Dactylosporangium cerinum]|uniref:DUF1707 domain-containing protein n=1 Tax=Dactylosporangium cerinum TaxID=1434730 RepID=A0ABV9VV50_9ACTN
MYPSPSFRASDADREAVVAHLGTCLSEGRLSLSEFDARTRHTYAARTLGELMRVVRDLPPLPVAPARQKPAAEPVGPVLALVLGIFSIPAAVCTPVGLVAGVIAVVLGAVFLRASAARAAAGVTTGGRGYAVAGLSCGTVGVLLSVATAILYTILD